MGASLKRPFKLYNIEARASKAIEQSKKLPKAPPRYPTEAAIEARNKASHQNDMNYIHQKLPDLDQRLKSVYVESKGDNPIVKTKRKLPEDRRKVNDPKFGYLEPVTIPEGRIPLRLALEMINSHKDDPEANSAKVLADKYKLDLETTHHILEYFQSFMLRLPQAEAVIGEPHRLLRDSRLRKAQKQLDAGQKIVDEYNRKIRRDDR